MQKLEEVCIQRPIFAVMLIMALVVVGGVSYTKLGVDRFPKVDLPIITVRTSLFGASPEEIVLLRLQVNEALGGLPPERRAVFLLREQEGWDVAEIGADVPPVW